MNTTLFPALEPSSDACQLRGLTLWQPWASLMALGHKTNETRSWPTKYRGPLVIHAAKKWRLDESVNIRTIRADLWRYGIRDLPATDADWKSTLGHALCVVELKNCVQIDAAYRGRLSLVELACGDYTDGRWSWETEMIRVLDPPVACVGAQRLWNVPARPLREIKAQLEVSHGRE